jgi:hypothetical protein
VDEVLAQRVPNADYHVTSPAPDSWLARLARVNSRSERRLR